MKAKKILVVEDDRLLQSTLRILFESSGYSVRVVGGVKEALAQLKEFQPDLAVLDAGLPDGDGMDLCAQMKASPSTRAIPVFMLTARGSAEDIVRGLERGAEDYLPKPYHEMELLARVGVIFRRQKAVTGRKAMQAGSLKLDPVSHKVMNGKKEVSLTSREFEILEVLMAHPGKALSRGDIIKLAWGETHSTVERAVDVHLGHLREKLGHAAEIIQTIPRVGYRLDA